jgi:predicted methyltransferase
MIKTSELFANENDPLTNSAFDPSIRGQTEKFVLLMQK